MTVTGEPPVLLRLGSQQCGGADERPQQRELVGGWGQLSVRLLGCAPGFAASSFSSLD